MMKKLINRWKMTGGKWKINSGVTIVELIIYIGLLSIFMLVLVDVFVSILNSKLQSESTSALDMDSRYILARLSYDVGNADSLNLPASIGSTGTTLSVTKGAVTDIYSLDVNGNLNLNNGTSVMKLNGNDTTITNLIFKRIGNSSPGDKPTVTVSYTIKSLITPPSGEESQTVNTTLGLR